MLLSRHSHYIQTTCADERYHKLCTNDHLSDDCLDYWNAQTLPHWQVLLSPVYTIQPVVKLIAKPVWQQVVSCIQTFNRLSNLFDNWFGNRLYCVYSRLSNQFDNQLNEQWLFVQHGCQTSCTTGLNRLYRVNWVLMYWHCRAGIKAATPSPHQSSGGSKNDGTSEWFSLIWISALSFPYCFDTVGCLTGTRATYPQRFSSGTRGIGQPKFTWRTCQ